LQLKLQYKMPLVDFYAFVIFSNHA